MLGPPIQLDNIAFAYGDGKQSIFRDVCLQIAPAARVVLVRPQMHKSTFYSSSQEDCFLRSP